MMMVLVKAILKSTVLQTIGIDADENNTEER